MSHNVALGCIGNEPLAQSLTCCLIFFKIYYYLLLQLRGKICKWGSHNDVPQWTQGFQMISSPNRPRQTSSRYELKLRDPSAPTKRARWLLWHQYRPRHFTTRCWQHITELHRLRIRTTLEFHVGTLLEPCDNDLLTFRYLWDFRCCVLVAASWSFE